MLQRDGSPRPEEGTQVRLSVGVVEQQSEVLQRVLAAVAQHMDLEARVLGHTALENDGGASRRCDVLLVGLDTSSQEALAAIKRIAASTPTCRVIVFGTDATLGLLPQAMAAGARRYLRYPFDGAALRAAIAEVNEELTLLAGTVRPATPPESVASSSGAATAARSKVVTVFSPKGGVGTTTLAVNLACALASRGRRVAIVDGNISFGNVGVFLNMTPDTSIMDLLGSGAQGIQEASVDDALAAHASGVRCLLAPRRPEDADLIEDGHLRQILALLRARYEYVVVDTWPSYDARVLAMLEAADQILVPTTPEVQAVKNLSAFLRVAQLLSYPREKLVPVLMRADSVTADYLQDIEVVLDQPLAWRIVSDGKRVMRSVIEGAPFVLSDPGARVSRDIDQLAAMVEGQEDAAAVPVRPRSRPRSWKRVLFGAGAAG